MADSKLTGLAFITGSISGGDLLYVVRSNTNYKGNASALSLDGSQIGAGTVPYARLPVGQVVSTVAAGNDPRFTDARTPTGSAGGVLSGTYPNPGFAVDMATNAALTTTNSALTSHVTNTSNPHATTKAQVGLGDVTNAAQTLASVVPNTLPNAGQILVGNAGNTSYSAVTVSGAATLATNGALTLSTVNPNVGTFGSNTNSLILTVGGDGRVTAVQQVASAGGGGFVSGQLFIATTGTGPTTGAEYDLISGTIPGGVLGTQSCVECVAFFTLTNNTGAGQTVTIRVKYGGTTMYGTASTSMAASSIPRGGVIKAWLMGAGATNAQRAGATTSIGPTTAASIGTGGLTGTGVEFEQPMIGVGATVDSTNNQTFAVTMQMSTNSANLTTNTIFGSVWKI